VVFKCKESGLLPKGKIGVWLYEKMEFGLIRGPNDQTYIKILN